MPDISIKTVYSFVLLLDVLLSLFFLCKFEINPTYILKTQGKSKFYYWRKLVHHKISCRNLFNKPKVLQIIHGNWILRSFFWSKILNFMFNFFIMHFHELFKLLYSFAFLWLSEFRERLFGN